MARIYSNFSKGFTRGLIQSNSFRHLIPFGAIDTHVHVFNSKLGPYAAGRAYTPKDAPLEDLMKFNESLSTDAESNTLVLVQPSPYENDCSVLIQSLRRLKEQDKKAFAIAVLDLDNTTDGELKEMHALGVRGIRLNFQADGKEVSLDRLVAALKQTADRIRYLPDWMIQLFVPGWSWDGESPSIVTNQIRKKLISCSTVPDYC